MQRHSLGALGAVCALSLSVAGASRAANVEINDSTPGELVLTWSDFEGGAQVTSPAASGVGADGNWLTPGETLSFFGNWVDGVSGNTGSGIVYIVDPGQKSLIRAKIEVTWADTGGDADLLPLVVTSTPFGGNLGALPGAFTGFGVPMPDGSIPIEGLFRNPATGAPVALPPALTVQYVGDLEPECAEPVLLVQTPAGTDASTADLNSGNPFELVDSVQFIQDINVVSLRWWGVYAFFDTPQADSDDFVFRVYTDVAGKPADTPVVSVQLSQVVRAGTGRLINGNSEYVYAATLPAPVPLSANTTYWIGVINDTSADLDDNWYWEHSLLGDGKRYGRALSPISSWALGNYNMAFELCGGPPALSCPRDFNFDGVIDGMDLAAVLAAWGPCPTR
jgi:hypothetical protein